MIGHQWEWVYGSLIRHCVKCGAFRRIVRHDSSVVAWYRPASVSLYAPWSVDKPECKAKEVRGG